MINIYYIKSMVFFCSLLLMIGGNALVFAQDEQTQTTEGAVLQQGNLSEREPYLSPQEREELLRRKRERSVIDANPPGPRLPTQKFPEGPKDSETEQSESGPALRREQIRDQQQMQQRIQERREEFKMRMQEHREELRSRAEEMKERIADRRENLRSRWEERKVKLSERQKEIIKNHIERIVKRMQSAIERLDKVADNLAERITILAEGGADVTDANANLEEAREAIVHAKILLENAALLLRQTPDMENPADAIGKSRAHFEDVKAAIREAHAALVEVITSLKGRSSIAPGTGTTTN